MNYIVGEQRWGSITVFKNEFANLLLLLNIFCVASFGSNHLNLNDENWVEQTLLPLVSDLRLENIKYLPAQKLKNACEKVDDQRTTWGCGKVATCHCFYLLNDEYAVREDDDDSKSNEVGNYPLALQYKLGQGGMWRNIVDAGLEKNGAQIDQNSNSFCVGAIPLEMAEYCERFICPEGVLCKSNCFAEINEDAIIETIRQKIDDELPLIFYIGGNAPFVIHIITVIGYGTGTDKSDYLIYLDSVAHRYFGRFQAIKLEDFIGKMNQGAAVQLVKGLDWFGFLIRPLCDRVASSESIADWNKYSFVTFEKDDEKDV